MWDAAIEHFTEEEIARILGGIREQLTPEGILSGYTLVELESVEKHLRQHEEEFHGIDDLKLFYPTLQARACLGNKTPPASQFVFCTFAGSSGALRKLCQ